MAFDLGDIIRDAVGAALGAVNAPGRDGPPPASRPRPQLNQQQQQIGRIARASRIDRGAATTGRAVRQTGDGRGSRGEGYRRAQIATQSTQKDYGKTPGAKSYKGERRAKGSYPNPRIDWGKADTTKPWKQSAENIGWGAGKVGKGISGLNSFMARNDMSPDGVIRGMVDATTTSPDEKWIKDISWDNEEGFDADVDGGAFGHKLADALGFLPSAKGAKLMASGVRPVQKPVVAEAADKDLIDALINDLGHFPGAANPAPTKAYSTYDGPPVDAYGY